MTHNEMGMEMYVLLNVFRKVFANDKNLLVKASLGKLE